jgi:hypothetical protein
MISENHLSWKALVGGAPPDIGYDMRPSQINGYPTRPSGRLSCRAWVGECVAGYRS